MTRGSIRGHVARMMVFVLAGLAIQTLYGLVDIYWVSRLGQQAVAAVSLSTNLMFVSMALTQMLSVGCVALVSQAAGRKEDAAVQRFFNQAQSLSTCAGVAFFIVAMAMRRTYAEGLAGDAETAELAATFLSVFIPSLALQFLMIGLGAALRGIGQMKPGLVAQTASVVLNMILAPFLVFGWGSGHPLGVFGAALATLISTLAAVLGLALYLVRGGSFFRLHAPSWRPDFAVWGRMLGIGLPAGAEFLLLSVITGTVYAATRTFGAAAQAGYGIGSRVMQVGFMPAVAVSFAAASVVGQNYGSREYARVRETLAESAKLVVAFMLFFTLVCHFAAASLVRVFSNEPAVVAAGSDFLRTIAYNYVASGLVFVVAGVFQGLGNTWPSLIASGTRAAFFVAALTWMSRRAGFEMHSIWQMSVASVTLQGVLSLLLIRRELALKAPVPSAAGRA